MARSRPSPIAALAVLAGVSTLLWLGIPRLVPGPGLPAAPAAAPPPPTSVAAPDEPAPADRQPARPERFCRGRCVDALDGRGLPALSVQFGELQTTTDADGRFVVPVLDPGPTALRITGGDVIPVERRPIGEPVAVHGQPRDLELGELRLRTGARLSGWLLDASRQPVANATLVARLAQPWRDDEFREQFAVTATTRDDGAFHFADPLPAGELVLSLQDPTATLESVNCRLAAGEATQVTVQLAEVAAADRLVGVLVDADGQPVAGALVQGFADRDRAGAVRAMATSDAHGRFGLARQAPDSPPVWLLVHTAHGAAVPQRADGGGDAAMPWGTVERRFVLPPIDGPVLTVVDADDGTPIELYAWRWQPGSGASLERAEAQRGAQHHPGGRCRLGGALVPHTLVVWPSDPRWLPSWRHAVVAAAGEPLLVALPRATDFVVTVRAHSGGVVPGARVALLRGAGGDVVHELAPPADPGFGPDDTLQLDLAACDADGRAVLRWWHDPEPRTLRVTGPGLALDVEVVFATDSLDVVVPDTGRVRFRLLGAGGSYVQMHRHDGGFWPPRGAPPIRLDAQGDGSCDAPVGTYDVSLARPTPDGHDGLASTLGSFATVTIGSDGEVELARDLRHGLQPVRLSTVLFVDGEPAPIRLWGRSGAATDIHRLPTTFVAGTSHFDELPAGSYRPFVRLDCGGQAVDWPLADWTTWSARTEVRLGPFSLRTTALEVQLEGRHGTPVTDGLLLLRGLAGGTVAARPDARGLVRLRGVPAVSYTLQFRCGDQDLELGSIDANDPNGRRRFIVD